MITTKTLVTAHTGSTKNGTYAVRTGQLIGYRARSLNSTHYVRETVFRTEDGTEYAVASSRIVSVEKVTEEVPEPVKIVFERTRCGRCGGQGRRNDRPGWAVTSKGICFQCKGRGMALTRNGYSAHQAYLKARSEALDTTYGELADGEAFWFDGTCYLKGDHPALVLRDASSVRRHNGAVVREIWKKIAKTYPGATLTY